MQPNRGWLLAANRGATGTALYPPSSCPCAWGLKLLMNKHCLTVYVLAALDFHYLLRGWRRFRSMRLSKRFCMSLVGGCFYPEPESFSQPGGRGFSASLPMHTITPWRSRFELMDSSSLTADGFIKTLYLGTPLKVLEYIFEAQIRFVPRSSKANRSSASSPSLSLTASLTRSEMVRSVSAALSRSARWRSESK